MQGDKSASLGVLRRDTGKRPDSSDVLRTREHPSFINCITLIPMAMAATLLLNPAARVYGYVHDAFADLTADEGEEDVDAK